MDPEKHKIVLLPSRVKIIATVFTLLLSTSAGFVGGWLGANSRDHEQRINATAQQQNIDSESQLIRQLAREVGQSVVSVSVVSQSLRQSFFGPRQIEQESAGTGVILNSDGVIITNRHVVPVGATSVIVTLSDGTRLENVEVIGRTNDGDALDIAFLKVTDKEGKGLKPATLGDSGQMEVGDRVIAIGNALGQFQNTVTEGIISGFGRSVVADDGSSDGESLQGLFQIDAAINPGNSGGPLVNIRGEVIGINTAAAAVAENIGFSIPINDVKGMIESVIESGKLERPFLGIRYMTLTDDIAAELELEVKRGAYIVPSEDGEVSIVPDSPAAKAGLKERDVIIKINGEEINERNSLTSLLGKHKVGQEVVLTIVRDGAEQEIKATLATAPEG